MAKEEHHPGLYERAVQKVTEWVKPSLHRRTQAFVAKAVEDNAKDNPRFARIIAFEVKRCGDGAGLTQDVAEPLLWTGIKAAVAVPIAVLARYVDHGKEHGKFKMIGYGAALGLLLNNAIEALRVIPRYTAGLQGSLEMAKDRERAIHETGIDPFNNRESPREINVHHKEADFQFTQTVQKNPLSLLSHLPNRPKSRSRKKRFDDGGAFGQIYSGQ